MPKPYPQEFRDDVVKVARSRPEGVTLEQIAKDFGIHPMTLSGWMKNAAVDAVSSGRFVLGLGTSGPQVIEGWHGVPFDKPLTRTRETVEICRQVWRRERVIHDGVAYQLPLPPDQGTGLGKPLKLIHHPVRPDLPIHIASMGPKNVQLTAEVADGWLPFFYDPATAPDVWGDDLAAGTAARDPQRAPLEVVAPVPAAVCDDPVQAARLRDAARPMTALYVGGMGAKGRNYYNDVFARLGYEREAQEIQDLYLAGEKEEAAALVPDRFLESTSLIGDAGYIRDRIAAYRESGVTTLNVSPVGPDRAGTITQLKELTG